MRRVILLEKEGVVKEECKLGCKIEIGLGIGIGMKYRYNIRIG